MAIRSQKRPPVTPARPRIGPRHGTAPIPAVPRLAVPPTPGLRTTGLSTTGLNTAHQGCLPGGRSYLSRVPESHIPGRMGIALLDPISLLGVRFCRSLVLESSTPSTRRIAPPRPAPQVNRLPISPALQVSRVPLVRLVLQAKRILSLLPRNRVWLPPPRRPSKLRMPRLPKSILLAVDARRRCLSKPKNCSKRPKTLQLSQRMCMCC